MKQWQTNYIPQLKANDDTIDYHSMEARLARCMQQMKN